MVKWMFFLLLPVMVFSQDVKVNAIIDSAIAGDPIQGTVTIEHNHAESVDPKSFTLNKKKLPVSLVRSFQVTPPDPLTLSIYSFTLPPQEKGLYVLPEISVRVGEKRVQSPPSSYEVLQKRKVEGGTTPILTLEPFIDSKLPLYPGQKVRVGYRYYFSYSIELEKEEVPLLDPKGFNKIGSVVLKSAQEGNLSVLEASLVIEAEKPGSFKVPPSVIAGRPYVLDSTGKRVYGELLTAEAPEITLEVAPFPQTGKPGSFTGAIGNFSFSTELVGPNSVEVGETLLMKAKVTGQGDFETVTLPDLSCQPQMSGFFKLGDLPPVPNRKENGIEWEVELRPLNTQIQSIPTFEFSSFDPTSGKYIISKTKPIPIVVIGQDLPSAPSDVQQQAPNEMKPLEIAPNYPLEPSDLKPVWFGTWWTLLLIPVGFFLLFIQWQFKNYIEERKTMGPAPTSQDLFKKLQLEMQGTDSWYRLAKKCLEKRAEESLDPEVAMLLQKLQRGRYGKYPPLTIEEIAQAFGEKR
jgi:hypothetical protein